jgi:hypothetical protein
MGRGGAVRCPPVLSCRSPRVAVSVCIPDRFYVLQHVRSTSGASSGFEMQSMITSVWRRMRRNNWRCGNHTRWPTSRYRPALIWITSATNRPELAPSSDDPFWDASALVQLIRTVIRCDATQDTAAFVAPRSNGFVPVATGCMLGLMLWFMRNRFVGSYLFFRVTRRSKLAP